MRRREFIAGLGGAVAWPQWVGAQKSGRTVRLGYVWIGKKGSESSTLDGMRLGLRDLGYTEGKDYVFEDRYADSDPGRLPAIFAELVGLKVDLILSPGNVVTKIAAQATSTIPIIATAPDLLAAGFVKSLARPGGNVTGMSLTAGAALAEKWLELVTEIVPDVKRVALLMNSLSSTSVDYADRY